MVTAARFIASRRANAYNVTAVRAGAAWRGRLIATAYNAAATLAALWTAFRQALRGMRRRRWLGTSGMARNKHQSAANKRRQTGLRAAVAALKKRGEEEKKREEGNTTTLLLLTYLLLCLKKRRMSRIYAATPALSF